MGDPADFRSDDGLSGAALMTSVFTRNTIEGLHRGAVREALAAAHSVAMFGRQETRDWDGESLFIANNGHGDYGALCFRDGMLVGVAMSHEHPAIRVADVKPQLPADRAAMLDWVLALPLFAPMEVTAVFWDRAGEVVSHVPWPEAYATGAELFEHELMSDAEWLVEASEYYDSPAVMAHIVKLLRRHAGTVPLRLSPADVELLFPASAPHRREGIDALLEQEIAMFDAPLTS